MSKYTILRSYLSLPAGQLGDYALHIGAAMTGNINFVTPAPPYSGAAITTAANNYIIACGAAVDGNRTTTANKAALQATLIGVLDATADHVELYGGNNPVKFTSAGFTLASNSHAQALVGSTGLRSVTNLGTTKLALDVVVAANAWCYIIQISTVPNVWTTVLVITKPSEAVLTGLIPGTIYAIRICAMGSGNQQSEWSDTVSHMST